MTPLHCVLWHTEGTAVSGLLSWMHRLKQTLPPAGVRLELASLELQPFKFEQVAEIDSFYQYRIRTPLEWIAFLKKNRNAVHLINHAFEYVGLTRELNAGLLSDLKLVGICHTDQPYYYDHLKKVDPFLRGMIAVSPYCAQRLQKLFPHRLGTVPVLPDWDMPVPPPRKNFRVEGEPLRLLFNGRILQVQKRVLDLSTFVDDLGKIGVNCELTIAGDGPDLPALRKALSRPGPVSVRFTGALPPWEMEPLLAGHDIFLQVSEFEGASVSLMEGMIHGLAPVVTQIDSGTELLTHDRNALLAKVGDTQTLATHIATLDRDRARLAALAGTAYDTAAAHLRQLDYPNRFTAYMRERALAE